MNRLTSACLIAMLMSVAGSAAAADPTKTQCVDASTTGQNLRRDGKLAGAKSQFAYCSDPKCPAVVRTDCTHWFDEVDAAFPSMIFDVTGTNGSDLSDVTITVDGNLAASKIDGTPLPIDPGPHEFKFVAPGEKDVTKTFVLKEGEKSRHEKISFAPEAPPAPPPVVVVVAPPPPSTSPISGDMMRIGGLVLAAGGVIGLGAGILYGTKASSAWSDQKKDCANLTDCKNHPQALSDHDAATTWGRFSTTGFIIGAVLLAGGAVLFFTAPKSDQTTGQLRDPLRFDF